MSIRGLVILAAYVAATMTDDTQRDAVEIVLNGINQFAPTLYNEVANGVSGNLIISPLGASIALAMFGYGSRGKTRNEFKRVLHLPENPTGKIGYGTLIDSLNTAKNVELRLGTNIFINKEYTIEQTYHKLIQTTFRSSFHKSDFTNAEKAVNKMNELIKNNVNNSVTEVLTPDIFPKNPNMVLVNVIYFKANWFGTFRELLGTKRPFHLLSGLSVKVPFRHRSEWYKYGVLPKLKIKFIEIPYEDEDFRMLIIMPVAIDGLLEVEKYLAYYDINELLEAAKLTRVEVFLPKFRIETTIDLIPDLRNMGLRRAFSEELGNFPEIFDNRLYLDNFVQKAIIDMNGDRTYSDSIITEISVRLFGAVPRSKIFYVDHPFFFSILKKDTLINKKFQIFSGRVLDPTE